MRKINREDPIKLLFFLALAGGLGLASIGTSCRKNWIAKRRGNYLL